MQITFADNILTKYNRQCDAFVSLGSHRYAIAHSIISHHVLGKRVPMLDQFSRGLDVLGLMDIVQSFPQ